MQYVIRFCSVCQRDTLVQVHNNGFVRCLTHEPIELTTEQRANMHNDDVYIAQRVKK